MLRNKILYGGLLVISAIMSILYNRYVMIIVFLILLFFPVVMFLLLCYSYFFIDISIDIPKCSITRQEQIEIKLSIKNRGIFPISNIKILLEYENCFTKIRAQEEVWVSIPSKSEQVVQCCTYGVHCGNIIVNLKKIVIYDMIQLFAFSKKKNVEKAVSIYPKIHQLETDLDIYPFDVLEESDIFSKIKSGDDPSEVFDIREYREGDKLQRIHWKLSSKKEKWMVKEFSLPIGCSICLLIDFYYKGKDLYTFLDAVLETVLAYSFYFLENSLTHKIIWYNAAQKDFQTILVKEEEDFYEAIENLLQIEVYSFEEIFLAMYRETMGSLQIPNLFYFGSEISKEKREIAQELGFQIIEVDEIE